MSPSKLKYSFKDRYGTTIISYQQTLRVDRAKKLLKNTDLSIQEIAGKVGYANPSSLSKLFLEETGMKPMEYRKQHRSR